MLTSPTTTRADEWGFDSYDFDVSYDDSFDDFGSGGYDVTDVDYVPAEPDVLDPITEPVPIAPIDPVVYPDPAPLPPIATPEPLPVVQPDVQPVVTPVVTPEPLLVLQPDVTPVVTPEPLLVLQPDVTPVVTPDVTPEPSDTPLPYMDPDVTPGFGPTPEDLGIDTSEPVDDEGILADDGLADTVPTDWVIDPSLEPLQPTPIPETDEIVYPTEPLWGQPGQIIEIPSDAPAAPPATPEPVAPPPAPTPLWYTTPDVTPSFGPTPEDLGIDTSEPIPDDGIFADDGLADTGPTDWVIDPSLEPLQPTPIPEPDEFVYPDVDPPAVTGDGSGAPMDDVPATPPPTTPPTTLPTTPPTYAPTEPSAEQPTFTVTPVEDIGVDLTFDPDDDGVFATTPPLGEPTDWTVNPDLIEPIEPTVIAPTDPLLLPVPQPLDESSGSAPAVPAPAPPAVPATPAVPTAPAPPALPALPPAPTFSAAPPPAPAAPAPRTPQASTPTFTPAEDLGFDPTYDPDSTGIFALGDLGVPTDWWVDPDVVGTLLLPKSSSTIVVDPRNSTFGFETTVPINNGTSVSVKPTVCMTRACNDLEVKVDASVAYSVTDSIGARTGISVSDSPFAPGTRWNLGLNQSITYVNGDGTELKLGANATFTSNGPPQITLTGDVGFQVGKNRVTITGTLNPGDGSGSVTAMMQSDGFAVGSDVKFKADEVQGRFLLCIPTCLKDGLDRVQPPNLSPVASDWDQPLRSTAGPGSDRTVKITCSGFTTCPLSHREVITPSVELDEPVFARSRVLIDAHLAPTSFETSSLDPFTIDSFGLESFGSFGGPSIVAQEPWLIASADGSIPMPARSTASADGAITGFGYGPTLDELFAGSQPPGQAPSRAGTDAVTFSVGPNAAALLGPGDPAAGGGAFSSQLRGPAPGLFDLHPKTQLALAKGEFTSLLGLTPTELVYAATGVPATIANQSSLLRISPFCLQACAVAPRGLLTDLLLGVGDSGAAVLCKSGRRQGRVQHLGRRGCSAAQ